MILSGTGKPTLRRASRPCATCPISWSAIRCPTLVITGDGDFGNGPEMSAAIASEIARLLVLPSLRHMALAEAPAAVNDPVLAFLQEVLA